MTPEKMTNAELAEWLVLELTDQCRHELCGTGGEIAKRLLLMPEPTNSEFVPGWKGKTKTGSIAEIHAEKDGRLYGWIELGGQPPLSGSWSDYGVFLSSGNPCCNDLIPNAPDPRLNSGAAILAGLKAQDSQYRNMKANMEIFWRVKGSTYLGSKDEAERRDGEFGERHKTGIEKVEVRVVG